MYIFNERMAAVARGRSEKEYTHKYIHAFISHDQVWFSTLKGVCRGKLKSAGAIWSSKIIGVLQKSLTVIYQIREKNLIQEKIQQKLAEYSVYFRHFSWKTMAIYLCSLEDKSA